MSISRRNFVNDPDPDVDGETHFIRCNFAQTVPLVVGPNRRGVRLFPGVSDGIGWIFDHCNLCNAEPPPNATVIGGLTCIKDFNLVTSTETVTVDGEVITLDTRSDRIYGRYIPATGAYEDKPMPEDVEID